MNKVQSKYLGKIVLVCMDDNLIFSKSPEEHARHLDLVLRELQEAQLYLCKRVQV